ETQSAWVRICRCDEVLKCLDLRACRDDEPERHGANPDHGYEVIDLVGELVVDQRVYRHCDRGVQQVVAICGHVGCCLGANDSTGANFVLNDDCLACRPGDALSP